MKTQFITYLILAFGLTTYAQTTAIPDPFFEQALIDLGIDSDGEINGQILTTDAEQVTNLSISYLSDTSDDYIQVLTGIEAFINLDTLTINGTMIEDIDLSTLTQLKYLDVNDNMLTELDVSNNPLLEFLRMDSTGDVYPINNISEIDLSNNPNINHIEATGIDLINLKNNNNNENMKIWVGCPHCLEEPIDYIWKSVCIIVDDAEAAQNLEYPYSEWTIWDRNINLSLVDGYIDCTASTPAVEESSINIYPNPAKDIVYFDLPETIQINKAEIIDYTGKVVQTEENITQNISVKSLATGTYILRLSTNKGIHQHKIIVQ